MLRIWSGAKHSNDPHTKLATITLPAGLTDSHTLKVEWRIVGGLFEIAGWQLEDKAMDDETDLLTVGELMERLKRADPSAVVAIQCDDSYYSGPAEFDTYDGSVAYVGPHDYQTASTDFRGRPTPTETRRYPGGWSLANDDDTLPEEQKRVPAFVLMTGG